MSILAKRSVLAALTLIGLVLLVFGLWFAVHLGPSGSATFTTRPPAGAVVVVEPSVLNRVASPVRVTAVGKDGSEVWIGRATPSDSSALVGTADRVDVTGAHVSGWSLRTTRSGSGRAPALAGADIWRETRDGHGAVGLTVTQADAPEALVIAKPDGSPADLTSVTVTVQRRTWFFQSMLALFVGLLAAVAGAAGLWQLRRPSASSSKPERPDAERPEAEKPEAEKPEAEQKPAEQEPAEPEPAEPEPAEPEPAASMTDHDQPTQEVSA